MPKNTFNQLQPEKRKRIMAAARRAFAERGYNGADVAFIAAGAGVAKGSLYNYFSGKEELYLHVCRHGIEAHRTAVWADLDPGWDIYRQVDHIFRRGVDFVLANPDYVRLYLDISSTGMDSAARRLTPEVERFTADRLKAVLKRDVAAGLVSADLDINLSAFLINSLYIVFVASLVSDHFKIRMREYLEIEGDLDRVSLGDRLEKTIALIGRLLRPGGEGKQ